MKIKRPSIEGLKKIQKNFKEIYNKQPPKELMGIFEEKGELMTVEKVLEDAEYLAQLIDEGTIEGPMTLEKTRLELERVIGSIRSLKINIDSARVFLQVSK